LGSQQSRLPDFRVAGLLDCWIAGLLDCWIAGLPGHPAPHSRLSAFGLVDKAYLHIVLQRDRTTVDHWTPSIGLLEILPMKENNYLLSLHPGDRI
jgi:hypothetical protein